MTKREVIEILHQFNDIYKEEGFEIVSLFGSYARGTEDPFSDIDLAYRIDHERFHRDDAYAKLDAIARIKSELERSLRRKVDLIPANTSNPSIRKSLEEEQIAI